MPNYKSLSVLLLFALLIFACNDTDILARPGETKIPDAKICLLKNASHGHGIVYNFNYDNQKLLTTLAGFSDFDKISYENNLPVKAENTKDKSYYITFDLTLSVCE
ncbi:MAG: hypothetical protein EOO39_05445 [Cytophagaceae bacterium]|nr:MAG: hypothetical protein EOO39_05445 [Cytophagaceae bacterium]